MIFRSRRKTGLREIRRSRTAKFCGNEKISKNFDDFSCPPPILCKVGVLMFKNISKTTIGTLVLTAVSAFLFGAEELEKNSPLSVGAEIFQAFAREDIFDDYRGRNIDKIDLTGANVKISYTLPHKDTEIFDTEFFGLMGFATGSNSISTSDQINATNGRTTNDFDTDVSMFQMLVGVNLRYTVSERVSVFGGVKVGFGYFDVSTDAETETLTVNNGEIERTRNRRTAGNSDIGINYGLGVGVDFAITENHAITLGLDYLASTARPEINTGGNNNDDIKMNKQSYGIISLGYRYNF